MNYLQPANNFSSSDSIPVENSANFAHQQKNLEMRMDRGGALTYHSVAHDTTGGVLEKVYDKSNHLLKVIKCAGGSRSETYLDPQTGQRSRVNELATMPDGNLISSDIVYHCHDKSSQVVTILKQSGLLVRIVERETSGSVVTFQGQTEYDINGTPARTVNQHMDPQTSLLMHREQIHWMSEGLRAMTEHFYFDEAGNTLRYTKCIHYSDGSIFSEETQQFTAGTSKLVRREIAAFDVGGRQTCRDILQYAPDGEMLERQSTFFDGAGNAIITRKSDCHGISNDAA